MAARNGLASACHSYIVSSSVTWVGSSKGVPLACSSAENWHSSAGVCWETLGADQSCTVPTDKRSVHRQHSVTATPTEVMA